MRDLKSVFRGVKGIRLSKRQCALTHKQCRECHEVKCPCLVDLVFRYNRVIGWVGENGRILKTNPSPGRSYKQKVLGVAPRERGDGRYEEREDRP